MDREFILRTIGELYLNSIIQQEKIRLLTEENDRLRRPAQSPHTGGQSNGPPTGNQASG